MTEKSILKLVPHDVLPDQQAIEVWYGGKFIATVYGADGPGVRVITKHPVDIIRGGMSYAIKVIEVKIELKE